MKEVAGPELAELGARISFRGKPATIIGTRGAYLQVEMDEESEECPGRRCLIHPTWMVEYEHDWVFTFGSGIDDLHRNCYVVIRGTEASAREEAVRRYGNRWANQYLSEEAAGVEEFGLRRID